MRKYFRPAIFSFVLAAVFLSFGCSKDRKLYQGMEDMFREKKLEMARLKDNLAAETAAEADGRTPERSASDFETLGDSYLKRGELALAFLNYTKAAGLEPENPVIKYKIGRLLLKKGSPEEAGIEFEEIIKQGKKPLLGYEGLGRVFFRTGDLARAKENFEGALKLDPSHWQARNFLGMLHDRRGEYGEAVRYYESAMAGAPEEPVLFNNLGVSLYRSGDHTRAAGMFERALELRPEPKVYNNLALTLARLQRYPEALEIFTAASNEWTALNNLGLVYLAQGKYREAEEAFSRAAEKSPRYFEKAIENLEKARTRGRRAA